MNGQPNKDKKYFAAIDLGTNSCRLLIADEDRNYVYADAVSTRMGEGLYSGMCFTPEAIERGVKCFYDFKQEMDKYNIHACRAIATASCRMAQNSKQFLDKVYYESLIKIDVIDGLEEARLNLKGALQHVCGQSKYVVVYDLGGGSTEITLATNEANPQIIHSVSIPWGARNASEAFDLVEYDAVKADKLENEIAAYTDRFIEDAKLEKYRDSLCFVATSSTPLRFVSMIRQFGKYDRDRADGIRVNTSDIDEQISRIFKLTQPEMLNNPYIGDKRSYIFISACVIFQTIYKHLRIKEITASLKSAKDGIIEELIDEYKSKGLSNG